MADWAAVSYEFMLLSGGSYPSFLNGVNLLNRLRGLPSESKRFGLELELKPCIFWYNGCSKKPI
jgi:hypothetical protein